MNGAWKEAFERTVGEAGVQAPTPPAIDRYTAGATTATTAAGGAGATTTTVAATSTTKY